MQPRPGGEPPPGRTLPEGVSLDAEGTPIQTATGRPVSVNDAGEVRDPRNTVTIPQMGPGGGPRAFDLTARSRLRISGEETDQTRRARDDAMGEYLNGMQAANDLWFQARSLRRELLRAGPNDRLSQLGDVQQTRIGAALRRFETTIIDVQGQLANFGVVSGPEAERATRLAGIPDFIDQVLSRVSDEVASTIAERIGQTALVGVDLMRRASVRNGVELPEDELARRRRLLAAE